MHSRFENERLLPNSFHTYGHLKKKQRKNERLVKLLFTKASYKSQVYKSWWRHQKLKCSCCPTGITPKYFWVPICPFQIQYKRHFWLNICKEKFSLTFPWLILSEVFFWAFTIFFPSLRNNNSSYIPRKLPCITQTLYLFFKKLIQFHKYIMTVSPQAFGFSIPINWNI